MRWLLWAVAAAAVLWAGLWVVAARTTGSALNGWIAAQGGAIRADLSVSGFPNRVDVTASDVAAGDTARGPGWSAPLVQIFAMVWKPWHLIVTMAQEQTLVLPGGLRLPVGADRLQASLVLVPGAALELNRLNVAGDALRLALPGITDPLRIEMLRLAAHRADDSGTSLHLGAEAAEILLPGQMRAAFPAGRPAPEGALHLRLDATAALSHPVDRRLFDAPPAVIGLEVTDFALDWGPMAVAARGRLAVDPQGFLDGALQVQVTGWQTALDLAVVAGVLQPGVAETWAAFAEQLQEPETGRIDLPLTYRNGTARFGPLPIGMAPRLR